MHQLPTSEAFTVSQYLATLNEVLTALPAQVVGEVSEFKISKERFVWFKLKDQEELAVLDCFLLRHQLPLPIKDGDKVTVGGYPKVFTKSGKFSFQVQSLTVSGEGSLKKAFEALKKKLELEGLFDLAHKQALPQFPTSIGIITSKEGAVIHDMLRTINERWGGLSIAHYPAAVQGQQAAGELIAGLQYFNQLHPVEVIIIARGGGSAEDLQAFNAEPLIRMIFGSRIPVVSGVGHEPDITLCDLVADVRAATPTAAAKLVVPDRIEMARALSDHARRLTVGINQLLFEWQSRLDRSVLHLSHTVDQLMSRTNELLRRFWLGSERYIGSALEQLAGIERSLTHLNPLAVLERGYSITTLVGGKLVYDPSQVAAGDELHSRLHQGVVRSKVI